MVTDSVVQVSYVFDLFTFLKHGVVPDPFVQLIMGH